MNNVGLVLEGGGMKGLYTAGVLEYFMEKDLYFPYVIGVSAGACMAASYLSRQKGRNKKVNIDLVSNPRYLSFRNLIRYGEIFGMDFLFDDVPNRIVPFDYDTFLNSPEQLIVGTTDCESGEAIYYNKFQHGKDMLKIIRASSSIPLISTSVEYENRFLLDGGIADPIPIKKSKMDGNVRNIVILTKPAIEKKPPSKLASLIKYPKHPKIGERILERHTIYNESLSIIASEQEMGNVLTFHPSEHLPLRSFERNQDRLFQLYQLGYQDAKKHYHELLTFIGN